jgi:hypothetical protein
MVRSSSADPDMVEKCTKCLINRPDLKVPQAMKLTNFSVEEVANLSLHRLFQQSLPGKTLEGLKAHALLSLPQRPGRAKQLGNHAINVEGTRVVEPSSRARALAATPFSLAALATSCGEAPKWTIIIRCVNGAGCGDDGDVDDCSKQAEELESSVLR